MGSLASGARMALFTPSLCRHGPRCRRHERGECKFAHSYDEVSYPWDARRPDTWLDTSHLYQGKSAPDLFVGQEYTCAQKSRVLAYLEVSHPPYPSWVNLYLWFLRHPRHVPDKNLDLGWGDSLKELSIIEQTSCSLNVDLIESGILSPRNISWQFGVDMCGVGFVDRMRRRLTNAVKYSVVMATSPFTEAAKFGQKRVCIGESIPEIT